MHLSLPVKSPFERQTSPPKASITLTLRDGARLTQEQVQSIGSLVAFAVEDLTLENVSITDVEGRHYAIQDNQTRTMDHQIEYTMSNEQRLARKAESQLVRFLGFENASVQVSAEYSFVDGSVEKTNYIADGKVASRRNDRKRTDDRTGAASGRAGGYR